MSNLELSEDVPVTRASHQFRPGRLSVVRQWGAEFFAWAALNRWFLLGIVGIITVLYAPVVRYEFLNWDDTWYIVRNPLIKGWSLTNLWGILTEPVARNFAPLTIATFLLEHTAWGLWPGGYHVTNIVLHVVNAALVFVLTKQLTRSDWSAWVVAALFAVHPVQIESVAWVSSRKTLLSSTFMLASGICWLRSERPARWDAWGLLWLTLALLSKASAVVVPPIVVAYDMFIGRKKFADSAVRQVIPCFLCVLLTYVTMSAQVTIVGGVRSHLGMSKLQILGIDATLVFRYLAMLALPQDLCVLYDPPTRGIGVWIALALTFWIGLVAFLWVKRDRFGGAAFAVATWLWLLFPVMNFFPITTLMNDRYMYLPCLPVFVLAVEGMKRLADLWSTAGCWQPLKSALATALSAVAIGGYGAATLAYLPVWQSPYSLWSYARRQTPSLTVVQVQWAITLHDLGETDQAQEVLHYALEHCNPDEADQKRIELLLAEWHQHSTRPARRDIQDSRLSVR